MAELLEYLIRVAGGGAASAEVAGLRKEFEGLGDSAARAGEKSAAGSSKLSSGLAMVGKVGLGIGAVLGVTAIKAANMSNQFSTEMLKIRTEGGATSKEFTRMRAAVLDMASSGESMGQGPKSLAEGLYHLESMGLRGTKALLGLKLASEEAAISGADLQDTTTAIGGAMFVAMKGTGDLTQMMSTLNAIAGSGNMRFQDLNLALGTGLLSSAKVAGLSLQETGAALGVLTDSGQHASSAAAQLATALHFLYAPSTKAEGALEAIHLSGARLAGDLRKPQGLSAALGDLRTHLEGLSKTQREQTLSAILPGGRGRVLLSLLTMLDRVQQKYKQINNIAGGITSNGQLSMAGHGGPAQVGAPTGFALHVLEQSQNPATKLAEANARSQASMVRLGDVVTRYLTPALIALSHATSSLIGGLTSVVKWFGKGSSTAHALEITIAALAGIMLTYKIAVIAAAGAQALFAGAGTIVAFLSLLKGVRSLRDAWVLLNLVMDANPVGAIVVAVAALAAGFVYAYTHVKWFHNLVQTVWGWIKKYWPLLLEILFGPIGIAVGLIIQHLKLVENFVTGMPKAIAHAAKGMWDGLKTGLIDVVNWIIARINQVITAINSVDSVSIFGHRIGAPRIGAISSLAQSQPITVIPGHAKHTTQSRMGHQVHTAAMSGTVVPLTTSAPVHVHEHTGDIVVQVGHAQLARINRKQWRDAMMAGT